MNESIRKLFKDSSKRLVIILIMLGILFAAIPLAALPRVSADDIISDGDYAEDILDGEVIKDAPCILSDCDIIPADKVSESDTQAEASSTDTKKPAQSGNDTDNISETDIADTVSDTDISATHPVFSQNITVDGTKINVFAPAGVFPADAKLSISAVNDTTAEDVESLIDKKINTSSVTYDIKVMLDGKEIQPDTAYGEVLVQFAMADIPSAADVSVYHTDNEITETEKISSMVAGNSVMAATDSFSYFTVEFTYGELQYVLDGMESVMLSEVLEVLGIPGTVTAAESSDESLFTVEQTENDWLIESHKAFTSNETLTLTIDGEEFIITVTDNIASGTSGTCKWTIDDNGVLTIEPADGVSGTLASTQSGTNTNYGWRDYRSSVTSVVVKPGVKTGTSASYLFFWLTKCTSIDLSGLDTTGCTSMQSMFGYSGFNTIDISTLNTASVTNMVGMFEGCDMTAINFGNINTSKVTNMQKMFYGCNNLTSLDITFDTSNVTNMSYMFSGCYGLTSLDVTKMNTSKVTKMNNMFSNCNKLTKLDVTKLVTTNVTDMSSMFENCSSLTSLDVTKFNTAKVTDMSSMFRGCSKLTSLDVTKFNTANVTDMNSMFYSCTTLPALDVTKFNTSKVKDMSGMFRFCQKLPYLDVTNFDTSACTDMSSMFNCCLLLPEIDVTGFNTSKVKDMSGMFVNCDLMPTIDVTNFDTSVCTDMSNMFYSCDNLVELDVTNFDTSACTNMESMFSTCKKLPTIDVSGFDTSNVTNMYEMFYNCESLSVIDVSNFDTANVTNMDSMFSCCKSVKVLDVSSFDTSKVTDMSGMFDRCESVVSIDASSFELIDSVELIAMFSGCKSLVSLDISSFDTANASQMQHMLSGLESIVKYKVSAGFKQMDDEDQAVYSSSYMNRFDVVDGTLYYMPSEYYKDNYAVRSVTIHDGTKNTKVDLTKYPESYPNFTGSLTATIVFDELYTVTFVDNGTVIDEQDVWKGEDATDPYADAANRPVVEGKYFTGWDVAFTDVQSDITVTALYSTNTYTVKFNANGGTGTMSNQAFTYGTAQNLTANAFSRTGYTFLGWSKTKTATTATYTDKQSVKNLTSTNGGTVTLYAIWKVNTYTVKFNANGGTGTMSNQAFTYGTAQNLTANAFSRTGYTFLGWSKTSTATTATYTDKQSVNNLSATNGATVNLYAIWKINSYTIDFDSNGGSEVADITQNYGTTITKPANPTRTGYTFAGWDTTIPTTMPAKDMKITAKWTANTYTVKFNANGGTGTMADQSFVYDVAQNLTANAFKRTGYTFLGWNTDKDATTATYTDKQSVKNLTAINGDTVTLYAIWTANSYTVKFDANGGTGTMADQEFVYGVLQKLTANAFKRTGYTFLGWNTDKNAADARFTDAQWVRNLSSVNGGTVTLYAIWETNQYTIDFDSNGGTEVADITQNYNTDVTKPADPTREGYTFAGWDTEIPAKMPAKDMKITAQWNINQYTIDFDSNGGSEVADITLDYNTDVTPPADPTREGYTFAGWDTEIPAKMPAKDMKITAKWNINQYTIDFDSNGGTEVADITQNYNTDVTKPADPTREGYTFAGWDTEIPAKMPAKDMKITAQWNINQYTIDFDSNGGTEVADITQNYNTDVTKPADPTRDGYTFAGWDTEIPAKMPAKDMKITAQWNINQYTIDFDSNGGTEVADITQNYNTDVTKPADPTREGYTFAGWDTEIPAKMPAKDTKITAQWNINQYTIDFDSNGGTEVADITQNYNTDVTKPADPTREGYIFAGWDTEIPAKMPAKDTKITAQWNINQYTIDFDSNGGTEVADITQNYNTDVTKPADPTREGYTFAGWDTEIPAKMPAKDMKITASWTANEYTVRFNANNGEGTMADQKFVFDEEKALSENAFTRTGYTFAGWSTDSTATTAEYTDKQAVKNLTAVDGGTVDLFAVWTANSYIVRFDANGGEGTMADQEMVYDTAENLDANAFTRAEYMFLGWNTDKASTDILYTDGQEVINLTEGDEVILYAIWKEARVTVTAKAGVGGTADPTEASIIKGRDTEITITTDNDRYEIAEITVNGTKADLSALTDSANGKILTLEKVMEDTEVIISFTVDPITGAPAVEFEDEDRTFFVNDDIRFKAIGFWQNGSLVVGDEYYVPMNWHHADPSGDWGGVDDSSYDYSASFKQSKAGTYVLRTEFMKYVYNGKAWESVGAVTIEVEYIVVKKTVSGGSETPDTGDDNGRGVMAALNVMLISLCGMAIYVQYLRRRKQNKA